MTVSKAGTLAALAGVTLLTSGCSGLAVFHSASLTFTIDNMECAPSKGQTIGTVCSFLAYYGNVSGKAVQVEPSTTTVLDKTGRSFAPVADSGTGVAFVLKPGFQQGISWSVTLPVDTQPAKVAWHGSKVAVRFGPLVATPAPTGTPAASVNPSASAAASASAAPSASATPSVAPSTPVPSLTPAVTTTPPVTPTKTKTKAPAKPTKTKTKAPTKPTTAAPTTTPPTTPPVQHTVRPRPPRTVITTVPPTTQNSTNPGGGVGGIG